MDADLLRIILAVLGALVIAGLYFWERRRSGDGPREDEEPTGADAGEGDARREPRFVPWEGDAEAGDGEPGAAGAGGSSLARTQAQAGTGARSGGDQPELVLEPSPSPPVQPEFPPGPLLLTLHVVAPGQPFEGADIVHSASHCGLEPGEMEIFHCMLGDEEHRETLFSMANMVKPGTFPFGAMAEFESPGLTLFAELNGSVDDPGRMEELLGTAHTLADELGGELRDAHREPFTEEAERRLRERVMRFVETRLAEHPA